MKSKPSTTRAEKSAGNGNGHTKQNGDGGLALRNKNAAPAGGRIGELEALEKKQMLAALTALKKGDFSMRLPDHLSGIDGRIADTFNHVVELNEKMAAELERLSRVVG